MKMADEENSHGEAFLGAPETDEPVAKRPKTGPVTHCGFHPTEQESSSCISMVSESVEAAVNCAQPAEKKEAKPVMAVAQAPAAGRGGDNNGLDGLELPVSDLLRPLGKKNESVVFALTHETHGMEKKKTWPLVFI